MQIYSEDLKQKLADIEKAIDDKKDVSVIELAEDEAALLRCYRLLDDRGKAATLETARLNYNYTLIARRDNFKVVNTENSSN